MSREQTQRAMIEALLDTGSANRVDSTRLEQLLRNLDRGIRISTVDDAWLSTLYEENLR